MYIKCTKCDGKGIVKIIPHKVKKGELPYNLDICEFCHGDGKVDWIHRIVGKGSLTWEQKTDIWRKLDTLSDWFPKKTRKKKKHE